MIRDARPDKNAPTQDFAGEAPSAAALAPPVLLTAEIERLQTELAATRAKLAEVEAKLDIDPLLDVFNRRGFERELRRAVSYVKRYGARAALVYLDLDDFKPVNDRHGHAAGDAVLKAVAAMLARNVRASDIVARMGGDEFAVLLWNLGPPEAIAKATVLEQLTAGARVPWEGTSLSVAASAGVVVISAADEAAGVLARADEAMYARKRQRKR
jgi:diguanylate cyclase (GGDEF)-like protein